MGIDWFAQIACPRALRAGPGGGLLFALRRTQLEKNRYRDEFWLYRAGRLRRLRLPGGLQNHWWWDENTLLIAMPGGPREARLAPKGLPTAVLQTRPLAGGKGQVLLRTHMPVVDAWPLPGGQLLVLAQWNPLVDAALATANGDEEKAADLLEKERGCSVLEELPFWEDGGGYVRGRRRLFVWDGAALRPLTDENLEVEQALPAPGGKAVWLIATAYGPGKVATAQNRLLELNLAGGNIEDRTFLPLRHDAVLPLAGGGALVAGSDMCAHGLNQNPAFYRLSASGTATLLDDSGRFGFGSSLLTDVNLAVWNGRFLPLPGGAAFLATLADGSHIMALDGEGKGIRQVSKAPGAICDMSLAPRGFYAVALRGGNAPELYHVAPDGTETRLTHFNAETNTRLAPLLPLAAQNEGRDIHGWVMLPAAATSSSGGEGSKESFPGILYVHGGPKAAFGAVLFHEMQYWAAQGYAVLLCNPSGSDGRGDNFADIRGGFGERDSRDLLAFLDAALAHCPAIDPARLGLAGGSYGGFMANWLAGHSGRFSAIVSQRSIANWLSMCLVSDIGYQFVPDQIARQAPGGAGGGATGPENNEEALLKMFWRQSPLAFAQNAATPTLFLHSDEDYRCPLPEGLQMYTALKWRGVPCRMVVFHGESHGLSRSGRPQSRLRRLQEMTDWFGKYLR